MEREDDAYLSVAAESRGVFRDRASKFIAVALPVTTEEEVKQRLNELRKTYHDANHHCFAYRLGPGGSAYRFNDDGEPSGSAGKPIYGQLLSKDISDVLVVVIRYFGGTKLGVPGLINAYRTAAKEALGQADVVTRVVQTGYCVAFGYPLMNEVMRILKEENARITAQESADQCRIRFSVRKGQAEKVESRFGKLHGAELNRDGNA
ncbi:MAG TPA: YigZ family protein [Bacteroidales bacterium]|nr:YigZ family protein [Bacteroidales bacterium]